MNGARSVRPIEAVRGIVNEQRNSAERRIDLLNKTRKRKSFNAAIIAFLDPIFRRTPWCNSMSLLHSSSDQFAALNLLQFLGVGPICIWLVSLARLRTVEGCFLWSCEQNVCCLTGNISYTALADNPKRSIGRSIASSNAFVPRMLFLLFSSSRALENAKRLHMKRT